MRNDLCVVACLIIAAASAWPQADAPSASKLPAASTALVEGKVVNRASGNALKKTVLTLRPTGSGTALTTETDDQGRFSFPKVTPGRYSLRAERTGYGQQAYGGRSATSPGAPIPLQAGEEVKDIVFKLTPYAVIAGRVVDEDGDPMAGASVAVLTYAYWVDTKQLQRAGSGSTGANGDYSISVPPGRYLLTCSAPFSMVQINSAPTPRPVSDAPELSYTAMFYPSAGSEAGASAVEAAAGAEVRGMDFHMAKVKGFHVQGTVAEAAPGSLVQLVTRGGNGQSRFVEIQPDRSFEFASVMPGTYNLMLLTRGPGGSRISREAVRVDDHHISGLTPTFVPIGNLTGTVTIEGAETTNPSGIQVAFAAYEDSSIQSATLKEDGKFTVEFIRPGRYHLWVSNAPGNAYVKAIRYGGRDIKDDTLDMSEGIAGQVDVVLSPKGADISGAVTDADDKPVPGATVVLIPNSGAYLMYGAANTDTKGQFRLRGVRPGDYQAFAWEDVLPLAWFDKEFLKPFASKGVAVSVSESEQKMLPLKAIPSK